MSNTRNRRGGGKAGGAANPPPGLGQFGVLAGLEDE